MAIFKCYRCLHTITTDKETAECPICGRKMIKGDFNRKKLLVDEIKTLINKIIFPKINYNFFSEFNLIRIENHFPTYNEIINTAEDIESTTRYISCVSKALINIDKYISCNATFKKPVELKYIKNSVFQYDKSVSNILKKIDIKYENKPLELPSLQALCSYKKQDDLLNISKEIIELLKELLNKMSKHISLFSIYGENCNQNEYEFFINKNLSSYAQLENCKNQIQQVLNKKIVFDFFNDGIKDYEIMNRALWYGMYVLLNISKPIEMTLFENKDEKVTIDYINEQISTRYSSIVQNISDENYLQDKNDDEVVDIVDNLVTAILSSGLNISVDVKVVGKYEKKLDRLIGLNGIKESVRKIKAYATVNKKNKNLNLHMCFLGNPGTGKTEVARIIAGLLHENGILPTNKVIETDRSGLVGEYVGQTPQKVNDIVNKAMGGVLFIDEAYSLVPKDASFDYGHEAVASLIKAMEDYRGKFCVILAGYKNPMNKMLETNPGFKSRIQFMLDFPNYSKEELGEIANLMLKSRSYKMDELPFNRMLDILEYKRKEENFANAREVRNILDQVIMNQNMRCLDPGQKNLTLMDIDKYVKDNNIFLPTKGEKVTSKILTAEEELEQLIGLESIKKSIKKIKAYAKKNKNDPNFNLHMCFYGNPGTGKTEVARIISRLLYDVGVLKEAKIIETDRTGLVGQYVGQTGPKTKDIIDNAIGGVLFIDEAYQLYDQSSPNDFGKEAIAVLLKEMEDKRGMFCVVMAGYRNEMQNMIAINPGLKSRIQFELDFPDYSKEELSLICKKFLEKKNYSITDGALEKILDITDYYRTLKDFANARTIRNIVDHVIMNQAVRVEDIEDDNTIIIDDVNEYIEENKLQIKSKIEETPVVNNQLLEISKYEISMLPSQYGFFNSAIINFDYINEAVVSISGDGSQGTGFIISQTGLCLTCAHCIINNGVNQKARVLFKTFDGKIMKLYNNFNVLKLDTHNDLALIKIDNVGLMYKFIPLSQSSFTYIPLSSFYVAGYPFGGESYEFISYTEGKIASINYFEGKKVVFADMFGQPGSSGSPIIDKSSNSVIGVFFGGIGQDNNMIKCFTPIDVVWTFINSILN